MPTAICNTCESLVSYYNRRGASLKDVACSCGSKDLSAVGGRWNDFKKGWDYYDRKGGFKKFVAQDLPIFEPLENNI